MKYLVKTLSVIAASAALMATPAAAQNLTTARPADFFTKVASRLLAEQLNVDLARIQIYPTNQYTPAVQRLLQVAANVYDAATNRYYDDAAPAAALPTVFQPVFGVEDGCVYITNYVEVTDMSFLTNTLRSLNGGAPVVAALRPNDLVSGVPLIIGAKKGFPNFNELAMDSAFQLMRRVQVTRDSTNSPPSTYKFNQMYLLNLTNRLGVECWNSYTNNYDRPVAIYVTNYLSITLTNDENFSFSTNLIVSGSLEISTVSNGWPGYTPWVNPFLASASFQIPLDTNCAAIPNSIYRFNGGNPDLSADFELPFESNIVVNGSSYLQPHWWLLTTNNVQVIMVDEDSGRLIDYVQLSGPNSIRDLSAEIQQEQDIGNQQGYNGLWLTNLAIDGTPFGLVNQIGISLGNYGLGNSLNGWGGMKQTVIQNEIDAFRIFFHFLPLFNNPNANQVIASVATNLTLQAPYIPVATAVQHVTWQANDPLVHYIASDLMGALGNQLDRNVNPLTAENLGQLNARYMPWGGNPLLPGADKNPDNLALKDPLITRSDDWDFPTNESSATDWLGRVHRGTPWQTIYLKASDILQQTNSSGVGIGTNIWMAWTGDADATDAVAMAPVRDWQMAGLLAALLNTNRPLSLLSVNNPDPDQWRGALAGLTVLTNDLADGQGFSRVAQFDSLVIVSNSAQAAIIADAIQSARGDQPGRFFRDLGDILAVLQLTEQSPFLDWNDPAQSPNGISDEAYEAIPAQLLWRLRADSIGSAAAMNGRAQVRFTGYDGQAYLVQVSLNLADWSDVSTNDPVNGSFSFTDAAAADGRPRFYRSVLLP